MIDTASPRVAGEYQRALHQPVGGRPRWVSQDDDELLYLSWGWRRYGQHPIPATLHDGWIYQLTLSGHATAEVQGRRIPMPAGHFIVIDRACPSGWRGSRGVERCRILSWIWRDAPLFAALRPPEGEYLQMSLDADAMAEITALHRRARTETVLADQNFSASIHALRIQFDVLLDRAQRRKPKDRFQAATAWLQAHPQEMHPATALSAHLQISAATLNRLFRAKLGHGVRQAAYAVRMKLARSHLAKGLSVKATAFRLGYSQADDFTRAYSKFWRHPPTFAPAQN